MAMQTPPAGGPARVPPLGAGDEAELVRGLKAGDNAAYERFVRDNAPRALAVARRFMRSEDDARDAVQEAFGSAFRSIASFDSGSRLSTWLHRIVVNACLMKLRAARRRPERSIEEMLPGFLADGHRARAGPGWRADAGAGAALESAETGRIVRDAIDELPDGYRNVLLLRDIEGLDTRVTGELLGMSESAVKTRLHRARQALRELLDPHFRKGSV